MNSNKLKQLALAVANEEKVSKEVEKFILSELNKQELKEFVRFYKSAIQKKRVYVTSSCKLSSPTIGEIKELYKDKEIIEHIDEKLGAGVKIQQDDIIVDYTFRKYINDTIEKLKN